MGAGAGGFIEARGGRRSPLLLMAFGAFAIFAAGCSSMRAGALEKVQPHSGEARVGNVYLLRGFIGIWSHGIDRLGERIREAGVRAHVYQESQWSKLGDAIITGYADAAEPEPLVLIGHSYGADDVLKIARRLEGAGVEVDLIVTLDPVTPPRVPENVRMCYNIYQSNLLDGLPFFRGVKLESDVPGDANLKNMNIRTERQDLLEPGTNHFNIEKSERVHAEVVRRVRKVCPPRN